MRKVGRILLLSALGVSLLTVGLQPVSGARSSAPKGFITARHTPGESAMPAWAKAAVSRARAQLNVSGPHTSLKLRGVDRDDLGMTHVRLGQYYKGVYVYGGQVIAHLDARGSLKSQSGRLFKVGRLSVNPSIARDRAIRIARQRLGYPGRLAAKPTARLRVFALEGRAILARHVSLYIEDGTDATAHHEYFVNAKTGRIAWRFDSLAHSDAIGTGNTLYSGAVSIHTDFDGAQYRMVDNTRGGMNATDMNNGTFGNGVLFVDADNTWGDGTNANDQSAGADAHFGAGQTWDYFLNVHGRMGIDGAGYTMRSRVHYGVNYANAFWDGTQMTYGDGDNSFFRPLVSLDVAGHEITHGLTEFTADLIYANESGASNESFSDIFGNMVEYYTGTVGGNGPDYWIGEDIVIPPDTVPGFRNMADPLEDDHPDNYAIRDYPGPCVPNPFNDNCGVHSNSGIQNNAFYLLAEGGRNRTSGIGLNGIGRAKAEKIFFRALTVYLFPSANFKDVRMATLRAANDLYPGPGPGSYSTETLRTHRAWKAVGVVPGTAGIGLP